MDLNKWFGIGRLTRDSALKFTSGGTAVLEYAIANNKKILRNKEWIKETYYFDCVMFGKSAEGLQKYLIKGKQVAIEGELQQKRWVDKESGQNRSRTQIYVNLVQFLGGGNDATEEKHAEPADSFVGDYDDDDIPF